MTWASWAVFLSIFLTVSEAFVLLPARPTFFRPLFSSNLLQSDAKLSPVELEICNFFGDLHSCGFPFRTILMGNGAILESTQMLGPSIKVTESPKTSELILTLASDDQSFEFHVKLQHVHKIALVERELPGKVLRIIRVTNAKEESVCSLILANNGDDAVTFFQGLVAKYGREYLPNSSLVSQKEL